MRRTPLQRRTPLRAKAPLKRTSVKRTTAKRPTVKRKKPTKTRLKKRCDTLFSLLIRAPGKCLGNGHRFDCNGSLQCAHIVPRRYLSVRWDEDNAVPLCGAHHTYWTHFPIQWDFWVTNYMGAEPYMALKRRAIVASGPPDYETILARLQARLDEIGRPQDARR